MKKDIKGCSTCQNGQEIIDKFFGKEPKLSKLNFESAKKLVQLYNIKSQRYYQEFQKTKPKLPAYPDKYYKEDWTNWYDFLKKEKINYLDFESAKKLVQSNNIKSYTEYIEFKKTNKKLPSAPQYYYKENWTNWNDFLRKEKN